MAEWNTPERKAWLKALNDFNTAYVLRKEAESDLQAAERKLAEAKATESNAKHDWDRASERYAASHNCQFSDDDIANIRAGRQASS